MPPPPCHPPLPPCHPAGRGLIYQKWPGWLTRDCYCCTPSTGNEPKQLICLMNYYFEQTIFGNGLNEEGWKWEICLWKSVEIFFSSSLSSYLSSSPPPPTPSSPLSSSSPSETWWKSVEISESNKICGKKLKVPLLKDEQPKKHCLRPSQHNNATSEDVEEHRKGGKVCALVKRSILCGELLGPLHRGLDRPQTRPRGL